VGGWVGVGGMWSVGGEGSIIIGDAMIPVFEISI